MVELTPNEARALGVLIEKAFTTPEQYPLSINALTNGANQKNNRDPVLNLSEDEVFEAVEGLRAKQLALRVDTVGSRVHKYKHLAAETLHCKGGELAVLAELMLRGPQTLGELRGRASRMHPMASIDEVKVMLRGLMEQQEPMAKELPRQPGTRAEQYAQLLAPSMSVARLAAAATPPVTSPPPTPPGGGGLTERVVRLENEVSTLRTALQKLAASIGADDPLSGV